ncbi:MAG: ATP synthase F1 subunit epsilon [Verrucomicrobiales bacterium]|nr:ATP synthase F1 subunit epsilon [Verrucomicrobiae bacterium]
MPLQLEIVTPEAQVFSDEVDSVVLPGNIGEMGVLPNHAPLVTTLLPGELSFTKGGATTELALGEGLVEITHHHVHIMTDMAVSDAEIDEAAVEAALQRAKDSLAQKSNAEEVASVEAAIAKSLAQLKLKRKRRNL